MHGEFDRANRVDGRAAGGVQSVDLDGVARQHLLVVVPAVRQLAPAV
jgi:hypothetical protein